MCAKRCVGLCNFCSICATAWPVSTAHLRPRLGVGQFAFDAQFVVARQLDVFVFLDQADDGLAPHGIGNLVDALDADAVGVYVKCEGSEQVKGPAYGEALNGRTR